MANCEAIYNTTIANSNATWNSIDRTTLKDAKMDSYFRPDTGAALLPWVYALIIIIAHIPTVIVRVVKWENVQVICLVSTLFTVVVYMQAYVSTKLDADKVLVWTPLFLVIDGGSMLQVFFLIMDHLRNKEGPRSPVRRRGYTKTREQDVELVEQNIAHAEPRKDEISRGIAICCAIGSVLLFMAVVFLQILGLRAAAKGRQSQGSPLVSWCSPAFQPFGLAVVDEDCHVFEIDLNVARGIGCIQIPGAWQKTWLTGTVLGTLVGLAFQFIDMIILWRVSATQKWKGIVMKRPWTTMVWGLATLFLTLICSYKYASVLPPGITERVMIAVEVGGPKAFHANLTNAGMRGEILAWNDGVFYSWNNTYLGYPAR